ncbi:hypothetical protein CSOJ01_09397 [Colletotrichum sojae]|uniref:Uncharacterized protein n=1 Tax=Colletotrichum sojae TaxID=2175907 RepID=A0A8H6J3M8_9PEZI|nr:hypothetical protein CSOJ01_09397 [Colletotrichum sojae]
MAATTAVMPSGLSRQAMPCPSLPCHLHTDLVEPRYGGMNDWNWNWNWNWNWTDTDRKLASWFTSAAGSSPSWVTSVAAAAAHFSLDRPSDGGDNMRRFGVGGSSVPEKGCSRLRGTLQRQGKTTW